MSTGCRRGPRVHPRRHRAQSPRRRDRGSAVPRVRPRGRGHQARSAVPAVRGAWPPPPRMRVERAAVQQITAASSVPRAVKDAKLRSSCPLRMRGATRRRGRGALQGRVRPLAAHGRRCDERRDGDSGSRAPRARRGEDLVLWRNSRGRRRWSARGGVRHMRYGLARGRRSRRHPSRRTGGSSRWRSRPDGSRRARARAVARTGAAHGRLHMRRAQRRGRGDDARIGGAWGGAVTADVSMTHGRASVPRCIVARRPGAVAADPRDVAVLRARRPRARRGRRSARTGTVS